MNDSNAKQVKAKAAKVRKAVCAASGVNAAYADLVKAAKASGRTYIDGLASIVTRLVKSTAFNHQQAVKLESVNRKGNLSAARDSVVEAYIKLADNIVVKARQYLHNEGFKFTQFDRDDRMVFLAA